ncbi:hypothetical protein Ocin01_06637 [Orchesella cincta]|uniref:Uncharacterized protein n=1 Tax=Orchesella cincta TaxID=48709 RepID=A0A1D2N4Q9_ORCCI|nr:hypothetical protein Ocin01_06637 [Orchesella cincta]
MSIVGIDFGHDSCVVAVAKGGRIKCVDNEQGLRTTPTIVAFGKRQRFFGVEAKNEAVTNPQNSIYGIKRYVGRAYTDSWTKANSASFKTVMMTDSGVGFQTSYLGQDKVFTTEQLVGMMFTHLKGLAEDKILDEVQECVISVPSYFTDPERRAVLDAAHIAGLLPVRLMNDTTAAALNYGMLKKDLPELNAPPRNVVIVDCGASAFQVCVGAFNKRNLTILASETDMNVGGRHFDEAIAKFIKNKFHFQENVDLTDISVLKKVLTAAEKLKMQMSTTTSELTPEIDYLERNVGNTICRATFEKICSVRIRRVETVLQKCFQNSKLDVDDIHSVEILGGSSRIPAIKRLIEKVFRKRPRSTMKSDEAVALGCAYQCSLLTGADHVVGNFVITDITPYQIKLIEQVMFPIHSKLPSNCSIRLAVLANSTGVAYEEIESNPTMIIGKVVIDLKDVVSKSPVINIMASVNGNGLCKVYSVTLEEKVDTGESRNPDAMDTSESTQQNQYRTIQEVMVENHVFGMQRSELDEKIREEIQMVKVDNLEKIRKSTRATLEWFANQIGK